MLKDNSKGMGAEGGVLISVSETAEPVVEYTTQSVLYGQCGANLPNCRPSLHFGRYQIILVGDRGTCV